MQPFFLDTTSPEGNPAQLFTLYHPSRADACHGLYIIIPPFAEELNRSRHLMSLLCRELSNIGYCALLFDLYGTGDSSGAFGQATWDNWQQNIDDIMQWAQHMHFTPMGFISIRSGALLIDRYMQENNIQLNHISFNPTLSGQKFINQFLPIQGMIQDVKRLKRINQSFK